MKQELEIALVKNLLEGKICETCEDYFMCTSKIRAKYNTCLKWMVIKVIDFSIASYTFAALPRKLNVVWTREDIEDE